MWPRLGRSKLSSHFVHGPWTLLTETRWWWWRWWWWCRWCRTPFLEKFKTSQTYRCYFRAGGATQQVYKPSPLHSQLSTLCICFTKIFKTESACVHVSALVLFLKSGGARHVFLCERHPLCDGIKKSAMVSRHVRQKPVRTLEWIHGQISRVMSMCALPEWPAKKIYEIHRHGTRIHECVGI